MIERSQVSIACQFHDLISTHVFVNENQFYVIRELTYLALFKTLETERSPIMSSTRIYFINIEIATFSYLKSDIVTAE